MNLLLVDDSIPDIKILTTVFNEKVDWNISSVHDGETALEEINLNRPDIIILDLNLPRRNGFQLLEDIKSDNELKTIPVVILSTSNNISDIDAAYRLSISSYHVKQTTLGGVRDFARRFIDYWEFVLLNK